MTTTSPTTAPVDTAASNPYLWGPFAPVRQEVTITDLAVTGTIPAHLDGRFLRIGPNPVRDPDPTTYHWFGGEGMVHGIRLRDGRAEWYRNRWVRSRDVAAALDEPYDPGTVENQLDFATNTNVIGHGGRTYAISEGGPRPYQLTDELDTVGPCDFDGTLPAGYTAHPHRDPVTGELHAITYTMAGDRRVRYLVLGTDGRIRRTVDVELDGDPMMHDFALTENHAVLLDLPVTLIPEKAVTRPPYSGQIPYAWDPDYQARLGVLPHDGGAADVRWFEIEPCYVFHPLNAYEERTTPDGPADRIVVDVVRFPTMFATSTQGPDAVSTLDRWTIDLTTGKVREERLDDRLQEFPRHDERLVGRPYRYGYTVGLTNAVYKHDLMSRTTTVLTLEPGDFPNELVFVPASDTSAEDDGILMGFVHRGATDRGDLVMLDAATLETVATVHLPVRVPIGFHGNWVPAA